jgi:hypothetical protein
VIGETQVRPLERCLASAFAEPTARQVARPTAAGAVSRNDEAVSVLGKQVA